MAFNNKNNKNNKVVKLNLADYPYSIKHVRQLTNTTAVFTLDLGIGVSLYSVKLIDGKNGMFLAVAESKGNDGIYYRNYGLYLTDDSVQLVIDEVTKALDD